MARSISLVAGRKDLGSTVAEVGRTGTAVSLTRRGKVVARIVAERPRKSGDPLAALRGSAELQGSFGELTRELLTLRAESCAALEQRASRLRQPWARRA